MLGCGTGSVAPALALRVASSHGDGSEGPEPTWVLKRLQMLDPGGSKEKRNRSRGVGLFRFSWELPGTIR